MRRRALAAGGVVALLVAAAWAAACGSIMLPLPTALDAQRAARNNPEITLAELQAGRQVMLQRCTGCHRPYAPTDHSPEVWRKQIAEMRERAKLDAADERLLTAYLVTMATAPAGPKGAAPASHGAGAIAAAGESAPAHP